MSEIIIIGGTRGIGRELAIACASSAHDVVIAGRDATRAASVADELTRVLPPGAGRIRGIAADLSRPHGLEQALSAVTRVSHLVLSAIDRDNNSLRDYNIDAAISMATVKLVGYVAAAAAVKDRLDTGGSILLFGGMAKERPYPGSTTVTSVNAGILGMVKTMAQELKPLRVNAIHPGVVGDSPYWRGNEAVLEFGRKITLTGILPTMQDMVDGCLFLMRNQAANGVSLSLDGGIS
jgi:NAD(P)-dependent dehydrogenase (short-subunit alcohol dehydrogenase family)